MKKFNRKRTQKKVGKVDAQKPKKPMRINILSDEEWDSLITVCKHSKETLENEFLVRMGRDLGCRIGETGHARKEWFDFNENVIRIPPHQPCPCGYCILQYTQRMKIPKTTKNISIEEVKKWQWQPKSKAGARSIYFGNNPETTKVIHQFFAKYDRWPYSVNVAEHRSRKLFNLAGLDDHTYHDLRKTHATERAAKLSLFQLMDVMGWDDINVAKKYVRFRGLASVKVQKEIFGDGKKKFYIEDIENSDIELYDTSLGRWAITREKSSDEPEWVRTEIFPDRRIQTTLDPKPL